MVFNKTKLIPPSALGLGMAEQAGPYVLGGMSRRVSAEHHMKGLWGIEAS